MNRRLTAIAAISLALAHTGVGATREPEPKPLHPGDPGKVPERLAEQDGRYKCFHENDVRRTTCFDGSRIAFNDGIRAAELLSGRPERVRATGIYLVVECKTARMALRSSDGAPLAGKGMTISAEASRTLSKEMCTLPATIRNQRLKLE